MSLLRRLISRSYRRARRAEAGGRYRDAAALYAEAGCAEEAANALLFAAARATDPDERLAAYHDALRWLPADHPRRLDVDARIGQAVLESAQRDGVSSVEERQRLRDAAARLERAGRDLEAATAYELLGQVEDAARCLQSAGEVERLEALLDESTRAEQLERAVRARVAEYEMAMSVGARLEAKAALEAGLAVAPRDAALADLLRRLEARRPRDRRVTLRLAERELLVVGQAEVVLGREGDVALRGASVSRAHAAVEVVPGGLIVRDLGSRNGTLAHGVPIAGELRLTAEAEIGLGEDVLLRLEPRARGVAIAVVRGLDRGLACVAGAEPVGVPGLRAHLRFPSGWPTLHAEPGARVRLGAQEVAAPVALLRGDVLEVDGVKVEVA